MDNEVHKLLEKQYLITCYIEPRLQIVNFIVNGYNSNVPVLMSNIFLHFSAHNYYRSIIVDLAGLFSDKKSTHKQNFYQIIEINKKTALLKQDSVLDIETWLSNKKSEISLVKTLRDEEIAHFDFSNTQNISMNFDNLLILNDLFDLAKRIITKIGSSFLNEHLSIGFEFGTRNDYIDSLEELIDAG